MLYMKKNFFSGKKLKFVWARIVNEFYPAPPGYVDEMYIYVVGTLTCAISNYGMGGMLTFRIKF